MARNLEEIWDGRFYDRDDLVRVGCKDCEGCFSCCQGMGDTIVLDPYDCHRLAAGLGLPPAKLVSQEKIALHVSHGVIVAHLPMNRENDTCIFLDANGRCSVHAFRPGVCRLFPLGRFYEEDGGFRYFLQKDACEKNARTKLRVSRWLDTPNLPKYEEWVNQWHQFLLAKQIEFSALTDEGELKRRNLELLQKLYLLALNPERDMLEELEERLKEIKSGDAT